MPGAQPGDAWSGPEAVTRRAGACLTSTALPTRPRPPRSPLVNMRVGALPAPILPPRPRLTWSHTVAPNRCVYVWSVASPRRPFARPETVNARWPCPKDREPRHGVSRMYRNFDVALNGKYKGAQRGVQPIVFTACP